MFDTVPRRILAPRKRKVFWVIGNYLLDLSGGGGGSKGRPRQLLLLCVCFLYYSTCEFISVVKIHWCILVYLSTLMFFFIVLCVFYCYR